MVRLKLNPPKDPDRMVRLKLNPPKDPDRMVRLKLNPPKRRLEEDTPFLANLPHKRGKNSHQGNLPCAPRRNNPFNEAIIPPFRPPQSPRARAQRTRDLLNAPVHKYNSPDCHIPPPSPDEEAAVILPEYDEATVTPITKDDDGSLKVNNFFARPEPRDAGNLMSAEQWADMMAHKRDRYDIGILMDHELEFERIEERDYWGPKKREEEREKEKKQMEEGTYREGERRERKPTKKFGE